MDEKKLIFGISASGKKAVLKIKSVHKKFTNKKYVSTYFLKLKTPQTPQFFSIFPLKTPQNKSRIYVDFIGFVEFLIVDFSIIIKCFFLIGEFNTQIRQKLKSLYREIVKLHT